MFEKVGIEHKIRENIKEDEEFEMLLGEIPRATSLNIHYPQSNGHHTDDGHGHGQGSFANLTMNGMNDMMNGMMYGKYDDDPSSYNYTCASPSSGFTVQSGGSSSSLFSGGHSLSENGSPTPPPVEELKSQQPCASFCHPNGLLCDLKAPNSPIAKMGNVNLIDELSRNMGRMCIGDKQRNFSADPNGAYIFDNSISATNRTNLEKYGASDNYRRVFPDYGGPQSSVSRSPMPFDGEMSSALSGLQCEYKPNNLMGLQYPCGRADSFFSQMNYYNSPSSSPCHKMEEQAGYYYKRGLAVSNAVSSITQPVVSDALFYCQQNGTPLNEEMGLLNMPQATTHPWSRLGMENILHCSPQMLNGRSKAPSNVRISHGGLEAFTSEDSLIIHGEGLNYVTRKGFGHPRGRNCKGSLPEIDMEKPQGKMLMPDGHSQFAGIFENGGTARPYCHFSLPPKCNSLEEARGYIYLIAKDQHGCRFLQRMFDEGTQQDVQVIFNEIIDHVVELMMNPFGNYLMQKLLEVCNEEQRMQILLMITEEPGRLVRISLNTHGTRVVQKLIETLKTRQQISLVISALEPGFLVLIKDLNGNHVVQRCLQCLNNDDNKFIFVAAAKYCVDIAMHRHGCCVLQRCISHSTGEHRENLVAEISANGLLLAQDAYGNYVVQFILELEIPSATSNLISQFEGNYVHLSAQKFSSHVVEKCLLLFNDELQSKIIHELLSATHFEQLLQDPHANYVVQTALRVSKGSLHHLLVDAIESHKAISRNSPYSKRIFSQKLLKK